MVTPTRTAVNYLPRLPFLEGYLDGLKDRLPSLRRSSASSSKVVGLRPLRNAYWSLSQSVNNRPSRSNSHDSEIFPGWRFCPSGYVVAVRKAQSSEYCVSSPASNDLDMDDSEPSARAIFRGRAIHASTLSGECI